MKHKILIADDEQKIRRVVELLLTEAGYETLEAANGAEALEKVSLHHPHLVLLDYNMPQMTGLEVLEAVKKLPGSPLVVMMTAFGSVTLAVEAIRKGAYDFIEKPFDNDKLLLTVGRALQHATLQEEVGELRKKVSNMEHSEVIVGESEGLRNVMQRVKMVAPTDATVLLTGESGTGKELVARSIFQMSNRSLNPFLTINCGAIPAALIESELFGHEKGAFTDAREAHAGTFERAHTGTLFLDEVGELPLDAQVKLLRVLEDRKITRVGGKKAVNTDVRIVAATNRDLEELVASGRFRADLFYRLNVFSIALPPLRQRADDIALLAAHFINKYNRLLNTRVKGLSGDALDKMVAYAWPGNIRELANAIQSALILTQEGTIEVPALPSKVRSAAATEATVEQAVTIKEAGSMAEKELIAATLQKNQGSRTHTATELGISRKTLFNKMKRYNLL